MAFHAFFHALFLVLHYTTSISGRDIVAHPRAESKRDEDRKERKPMPSFAFASLILPGKQEAWRRFLQEMLEFRQSEHEESRRRLGITYLEADDPLQVLMKLATSNLPFDRWFKEQLREFHSLDPAQSPLRLLAEQVFEWRLP